MSLFWIVGLIAASSAVGLIWRSSQSRVSTDHSPHVVPPKLRASGHSLTMLQISAPLCSYCQAMRSILEAIASSDSRTAHVDYDISEVPDLIERFSIRQTPTTLLVASSGDVLGRLQGATPASVVHSAVQDALHEIDRRSDEYRI